MAGEGLTSINSTGNLGIGVNETTAIVMSKYFDSGDLSLLTQQRKTQVTDHRGFLAGLRYGGSYAKHNANYESLISAFKTCPDASAAIKLLIAIRKTAQSIADTPGLNDPHERSYKFLGYFHGFVAQKFAPGKKGAEAISAIVEARTAHLHLALNELKALVKDINNPKIPVGQKDIDYRVSRARQQLFFASALGFEDKHLGLPKLKKTSALERLLPKWLVDAASANNANVITQYVASKKLNLRTSNAQAFTLPPQPVELTVIPTVSPKDEMATSSDTNPQLTQLKDIIQFFLSPKALGAGLRPVPADHQSPVAGAKDKQRLQAVLKPARFAAVDHLVTLITSWKSEPAHGKAVETLLFVFVVFPQLPLRDAIAAVQQTQHSAELNKVIVGLNEVLKPYDLNKQDGINQPGLAKKTQAYQKQFPGTTDDKMYNMYLCHAFSPKTSGLKPYLPFNQQALSYVYTLTADTMKTFVSGASSSRGRRPSIDTTFSTLTNGKGTQHKPPQPPGNNTLG